jgi:hypothetical protein
VTSSETSIRSCTSAASRMYHRAMVSTTPALHILVNAAPPLSRDCWSGVRHVFQLQRSTFRAAWPRSPRTRRRETNATGIRSSPKPRNGVSQKDAVDGLQDSNRIATPARLARRLSAVDAMRFIQPPTCHLPTTIQSVISVTHKICGDIKPFRPISTSLSRYR